MEILAIVLSGLLSVVSGGGIVLDSLVKKGIRSQIISVEEQAVRIDNRPSYQLAQGKVGRVRIASRGVRIEPGLRIAAIDLASDPLSLKRDRLSLESIDRLRESLAKPASGAIRLVLTQTDLNRTLQSPQVLARLQQTLNGFIAGSAGSTNIRYQLSNLSVELRPANRLEVKFKLSRPTRVNYDARTGTSNLNKRSRELDIALNLAIEVVNGKTFRILEPQGTVNGRPMSSRLLDGFAEGISDRLDLNFLEADGILTRILQLEIDEDKLELVSFILVETKPAQLSSTKIVLPHVRSIIHAGSQ